jgi:hypothetical protein
MSQGYEGITPAPSAMRLGFGLESDPAPASVRVMAFLGAVLVVFGAAGMACGFLFLVSRNLLDVVAGAAGFVAGAIFLVGGSILLAVLTRSPAGARVASHAAGCLSLFAPPAVAVLAWPILYFTLGLGACGILPFVLLGCAICAWPVSGRVARHLLCLWLPRGEPSDASLLALRILLFVGQLLVILASWPLFGELLDHLRSMGYKVGWS